MKEYLIQDATGARAVILPEKGATVISYCVEGREYLYRDQANLDSDERPRCGIPFLFPAFGRFPEEGFVWEGKSYPMQIHGFGHTSQWTVIRQEENLLQVELCANEDTLALYPFLFRAELSFVLDQGVLTIRQQYENLDTVTMPYSFGFHPYWLVEDEENAQVEVDAALTMDWTTRQMVSCGKKTVKLLFPPDFGQGFGSFQGARDSAMLHVAAGKKVRVRFDENFDKLTLWNIRGKGFICVEPINGVPNGIATGNCFFLAPGEKKEAVVVVDIL